MKQNAEYLLKTSSVWNVFAKIKSNSLINDNYLNLDLMKNLYVHNVKDLLRFYRNKIKSSQRKFAKLLDVRNISNYENTGQAVPFKVLLKASKLADDNLYKSMSKDGEIKFSCGTSKEIPFRIPLDSTNALNLLKFVSPSILPVRNIVYVNNLNHDLQNFEIHISKSGRKYLYSRLLWTLLNTFYIYEKKSKLKIPLSIITNEFENNGIDPETVIISLLLSEGSRHKKGFDFSNKSQILHDILVDAIYKKYDIFPTSYCIYVGDVYRTFYFTDAVKVRDKIETKFGYMKCSPKGSLVNYLNLPQPNLLPIKKEADTKTIIRIFATTEGGVSLSRIISNRNKKEFIVTPKVYIACAHPQLLINLYDMMKTLGFLPHLTKGKTWSGWAGLRISSLYDIFKFLEIGGFIPNVKIARTDSYFYDIEKQRVLLGILELRRQMTENKRLKTKSLSYLKSLLLRIITRKEVYSDTSLYKEKLETGYVIRKRSQEITKLENELRQEVDLLNNNLSKFAGLLASKQKIQNRLLYM